MALHVQSQVITPGEAPLADQTLEGLGAGVFTDVPRQFVRACELPLAGGHVAPVWLLPGVDALVGLEVGGLGVGFAATRKAAVVNSPFLQLWVVLPVVLDGGTPRVSHWLLSGFPGSRQVV